MDKKYTIQEVFNMIGEDTLKDTSNIIKSDSLKIEGYLVYKDSWRYRTFYQKGTKCACCGKEGTYFKLKPDSNNIERAHFNLYAEDGTLMTKDHIYPASHGGPDCIENFQTMCEDCNKNKKDNIPENVSNGMKLKVMPKMEIRAIHEKTGEILLFEDIEKAIKYVCSNFTGVYKKSRKPKEIVNKTIKTTLKIKIALDNEDTYCGYKWERI